MARFKLDFYESVTPRYSSGTPRKDRLTTYPVRSDIRDFASEVEAKHFAAAAVRSGVFAQIDFSIVETDLSASA